jgi:hypothetical protein
VPGLDLGLCEADGAGSAGALALSAAGGLAGGSQGGCGTSARLGGGVAASAAAGGSSLPIADELLGQISVVSMDGGCTGASSSAAAGLLNARPLASWSYGRAVVSGVIDLGLSGVSGGASAWLYAAALQAVRALSGAGGGLSVVGGSLSWGVKLAGASGGVAAPVAVLWSVAALRGLSGAEGWQRPQLGASASGSSSVGAVGLMVSGTPNVALSS